MQQLQLKIAGLILLSALGTQAQAVKDSDYPAAYFEPIILYQDPEIVSSNAKAEPAAEQLPATESNKDDRYPAAYFEPVIVFQDFDAINKLSAYHAKPVSKNKSTTVRAARSGSARSWDNDKPAASKPSASPTDGGSFPFLGLFVVAVLFGYIYWALSKESPSDNQETYADDEMSGVAEPDDAGDEPISDTEEVEEVKVDLTDTDGSDSGETETRETDPPT